MSRAVLTVAEALARITGSATPIEEIETVGLLEAAGRVLGHPVQALFTQPPFNASAMDGYAVRAADLTPLPARLAVRGEAAAGHGFKGVVGPGEAVRIFTGAPIPHGADTIVIQENTAKDGSYVIIRDGAIDPDYVRPLGGDFAAGDVGIGSGRKLTARDVTLAAAMGHATLRVRRKPVVAILATGDELVFPGQTPAQDQIICSNTFGIAAMVTAAGGSPRLLGIAKDRPESLAAHIADAADADILVTVGGASVGDHDLVAPVLQDRGMNLDFWKISMRPGKPLMYGRLQDQHVLGLPGNPVSSMICARLFLLPLIRCLLDLETEPDRTLSATTSVALGANGTRTHYMRARWRRMPDGALQVTPVRSQDSSLLTPLAEADCLIVREIGAAAVCPGERVPVLSLDF